MSSATTRTITSRMISTAFTRGIVGRTDGCGRGGDGLEQDVARAKVRADLALHALERVVDRLRVAREALADGLVAAAVEAEGQDPRLELGERRGEAAHERAQLLGADDLVDGVVHGRPGDELVQGRLSVAARGRRRGERDVLV